MSYSNLSRLQEIIDFRPVPAAGTSYDAKGKFVCTSGNLECQGHKWLSCAVEEFPQVGELVEHIAVSYPDDATVSTPCVPMVIIQRVMWTSVWKVRITAA